MKKYKNYVSNLRILEKAGEEDLTNEFIIGGIIDKFFIQLMVVVTFFQFHNFFLL